MDRFFKESLEIDQVPSSSCLRQRMDKYDKVLLPPMYAAVIEFLVKAKVPVTSLTTGYVALSIDVFPMDNSETNKEDVSSTTNGWMAICDE